MGCTCCKCEPKEKQEEDHSVLCLLYDGNKKNSSNVDAMKKSLRKHHVTSAEVRSLEDEITANRKGSGTIESVSVFVIMLSSILTGVVGYYTVKLNAFLAGIKLRVDKMSPKELAQFFKDNNDKIQDVIVGGIANMGASAFLVVIIFFVSCGIIVWHLVKVSEYKKQHQALHEYERELIGKKIHEAGEEHSQGDVRV